MNIKVVFIFTLITKVYCEYEENELSSSKLLKHLKTIASKENFVGNQYVAYVHTRKVDPNEKQPPSFKFSQYNFPVFNGLKAILTRKRNIRKSK